MTTVQDVPAEPLIMHAAEKLQERDEVQSPDWAPFARTGAHTERIPEQENWWFIRAAAVLRKVYIYGPIGAERLSALFGGKRNRGVKPSHAVKGSRNVIRTVLQQLEAANLVHQQNEGDGRTVTPEGQKFLDDIAHEVQQDLLDETPELAKYA
ncbi:MAG: 30S ribosomal protein S19e [Candidatus Thermoplasmatota archaeon]|nr:30S ribosomal protein S19e [Candidatus Thermoplasmatota archaeon]